MTNYMDWLGTYILDEEENVRPEFDFEKWSNWMVEHGNHVALDQVGPARISTIFLGMDVSGRGEVFETMVFVPDDKSITGVVNIEKATMRYRTKEKALEGHNHVVSFLRSIKME